MDLGKKVKLIISSAVILLILAALLIMSIKPKEISREDIISGISNAVSESSNIRIKNSFHIRLQADADDFTDTIVLVDTTECLADSKSRLKESRNVSYSTYLTDEKQKDINYYDGREYACYLEENDHEKKESYAFNDIRTYIINDLYYFFDDSETQLSEKKGQYVFEGNLTGSEAHEMIYNLSAGNCNSLNRYFGGDDSKKSETAVRISVDSDTFEITQISFDFESQIMDSLKNSLFYQNADLTAEKHETDILFDYNVREKIKFPD